MKLFAPDSMLMRAMSVIADFILLNLLTVLFSIPIVTSGAAVTALYVVMGRLVRNETYSVSDFFSAFKNNLKQATVAWLLLTVTAVALVATFILAGIFSEAVTMIISFIVCGLSIILLIAYSWTFPLISQFDNKASRSITNALQLGIAHLPRSIIMGALNIVPLALLFFKIDYFVEFALFWFIIWFAVVAYFNSLLLKKPFAPYREAALPEAVASDDPDDSETVPEHDSLVGLRSTTNTCDDLVAEDNETACSQNAVDDERDTDNTDTVLK